MYHRIAWNLNDYSPALLIQKHVYAQSVGPAEYNVNLQATKLFIVSSATKKGVVTTPLDLVLGSRYCIA